MALACGKTPLNCMGEQKDKPQNPSHCTYLDRYANVRNRKRNILKLKGQRDRHPASRKGTKSRRKHS